MAPKSQTRLVDQPPSASSSEDEEESDPEEETQNSEEESEEEDEEAPEQAPKKAPEQPPKRAPSPPLLSKKPTVQKPQSSSGSESESDEEGSDSSQHTEPSHSVSDFTIKTNLPSNAPPASKPPAKRPMETPVRESAKKKLKSGEEDGNAEEKKVPGSASAGFNRVWNEDDEIAVLEGMIDYKNQKGADPSADLSAFHEFIKGKLQADISRTQMYEKIRRFRKKFFTNIERGDTPDFNKPHDYKTFEVSKKVWGSSGVSNGVNENTKSSNVKAKRAAEIKKISEPKKGAKVSDFDVTKEEEKEKPNVTKDKDTGISLKDEGDFKSKYPRLVQSFNKANMPKLSEEALAIIQENLSLIGSSKAEEFEEQWTKILKEEAELFLKMTDLMGEQIKLIVETIKR
ncbi:PREDICTED: STOREKEEPER protein-like [Ipomoea nil]|uniref:STOREKEEPER protein-like n=1 Tax=Ipomoea nil TaxID=35883 RepID=UPI000901E1C4|nr:PREDICTED: STOREKEEPER protein-like [Ipomoea nil]